MLAAIAPAPSLIGDGAIVRIKNSKNHTGSGSNTTVTTMSNSSTNYDQEQRQNRITLAAAVALVRTQVHQEHNPNTNIVECHRPTRTHTSFHSDIQWAHSCTWARAYTGSKYASTKHSKDCYYPTRNNLFIGVILPSSPQ